MLGPESAYASTWHDKCVNGRSPSLARRSIAGVGICVLPCRLTSSHPKSSANMNSTCFLLGGAAGSMAAKRTPNAKGNIWNGAITLNFQRARKL